MIQKAQQVLNSITSTTPLSNEQLQIVLALDSLVKSNSTVINNDLANEIINLAEDQVDLVARGGAKLNEHLLSLLDMGLFLSM